MIAVEDAHATTGDVIGSYGEIGDTHKGGGVEGAAFGFLKEFVSAAKQNKYLPAWWTDEHEEKMLARANVYQGSGTWKSSAQKAEASEEECFIRAQGRKLMEDFVEQWGAETTRTLRAFAASVDAKIPSAKREHWMAWDGNRGRKPAAEQQLDPLEIVETSLDERRPQVSARSQAQADPDEPLQPWNMGWTTRMLAPVRESMSTYSTMSAEAFVRLDELIPADKDYMRIVNAVMPHSVPDVRLNSADTFALDMFRMIFSSSDKSAVDNAAEKGYAQRVGALHNSSGRCSLLR